MQRVAEQQKAISALSSPAGAQICTTNATFSHRQFPSSSAVHVHVLIRLAWCYVLPRGLSVCSTLSVKRTPSFLCSLVIVQSTLLSGGIGLFGRHRKPHLAPPPALIGACADHVWDFRCRRVSGDVFGSPPSKFQTSLSRLSDCRSSFKLHALEPSPQRPFLRLTAPLSSSIHLDMCTEQNTHMRTGNAHGSMSTLERRSTKRLVTVCVGVELTPNVRALHRLTHRATYPRVYLKLY
ncbi:hypothetical protein OF83DRAFT_676132 [Amylostereum chailletii]|nr:hypothetical protein OF83DRAFT_676132 [Amylostereum chailletii]